MKRLMLLAMLLMIVSSLQAATGNNYSGTGNWTTAANWSLGHEPNGAEDACINRGAVVTVDSAISTQPGGMKLGGSSDDGQGPGSTGTLNILPGADLEFGTVGVLLSYGAGTANMNISGGIFKCLNTWGAIGWGGDVNWNQTGGDVSFFVTAVGHDTGTMNMNVTGGTLYLTYNPITVNGSTNWTVGGTGVVKLECTYGFTVARTTCKINPGGTMKINFDSGNNANNWANFLSVADFNGTPIFSTETSSGANYNVVTVVVAPVYRFHNNAAGGQWSNPANWDPAGVPNSIADAYIGANGSPDGSEAVVDSAVPVIDKLFIGDSAVGRLDVNEGGSLTVSRGIFTSQTTSTSGAYITVNGGDVNAIGAGSRWSKKGYTLYNQSGGTVKIWMDHFSEMTDANVVMNITGGRFELQKQPLTIAGKASLNVSGTGLAVIDAVDTSGRMHYSVNDHGMIAAYGSWVSDPTMGGKLSGTNNLRGRVWLENPNYTLIRTDFCPPVDYNGDCKVNMADLVILVSYWLENNAF